MVERESSEHVESALVVVVRFQRARAVACYVVARNGVHYQLYRCILVDVEKHVYSQVHRNVVIVIVRNDFCLFLLARWHCRNPRNLLWCLVDECDELIARDVVGASGIVNECRVWRRRHIHICRECVVSAADGCCSVSEDCSVERHLAKFALVVGQQSVSLNLEHIVHVLQVLVLYISVYKAHVPVSVVNGYVAEIHIVVAQMNGVVLNLVLGIQNLDLGFEVCADIAFQIQFLERTVKMNLALAASSDVAEHSAHKAVKHCKVGLVGIYPKVERVLCRVDVSVYIGAAHTEFLHSSFEHYAFLFVVPLGIEAHVAHFRSVEDEALYKQLCVGFRLLLQVAGIDFSCCLSCKIYGSEVYDVENVLNIDVLQIGNERVCRIVRNHSADAQMLLGVREHEVSYVDALARNLNVRFLDIPY